MKSKPNIIKLASNITIINDKAQIVKIGVLFITY